MSDDKCSSLNIVDCDTVDLVAIHHSPVLEMKVGVLAELTKAHFIGI
jgi:hypothetical protein